MSQVDTTTNAGQLLAAASGGRRRRGDRVFSRTAVLAAVTILALLAGVAIFLVSYLIACTKYGSASEAEAVKAYAEYVVSSEGQELAAEQAGSAPLSSALTQKVTPAVEAIEAG